MVNTRRGRRIQVEEPHVEEAGNSNEVNPMQVILARLEQQQRMMEEMRAEQVRRDQERDATIATLTAIVNQLQTPDRPAEGISGIPPNNGQSRIEDPVVDPNSIQQWMERFQKYNPPVFEGTFDVQVAEDWIDQLEKIFEVLDCPSGRKARLAIFKLEKDARRWWRNTELILQAKGVPVTWEIFLGQFREKYFPQSVRDAKEVEFLTLKQGEKESFDEYLAKYLRLSYYSTYLRRMEDEEWSTKRLVEGLSSTLKERIIPQQLTQFNRAVEVCRLTERSMNNHAATGNSVRSKEVAKSEARSKEVLARSTLGGNSGYEANNNNNKRKRQQFRQGTDQGEDQVGGQRCQRCGKNHGTRECRAGQSGCFICGEKGHFARVCPKNADIPRPKTTGRVFSIFSNRVSKSPEVDPKNG